MSKPIRLTDVLGGPERRGLVTLAGRLMVDGVEEAEPTGWVERGEHVVSPGIADCYWFETTMERHERRAA